MDGHGPHKLATEMINQSLSCNIVGLYLINKENYPVLKRENSLRTVKGTMYAQPDLFFLFSQFYSERGLRKEAYNKPIPGVCTQLHGCEKNCYSLHPGNGI